MSHRVKALRWWVVGNLALLLGLPALAGWYLQRDLDEQFRLGLRTAATPDSLGLPIYAVAVMTAVALLVIEATAALIWGASALRRNRRGQ